MPVGVDDAVDTVNVEVAEPPLERVTLVMLKVAAKPAGDDASVRLTVPANPLRLVTVAVEVVEDPCTTVTLAGLAVMEKSGFGEALTVTEIATE